MLDGHNMKCERRLRKPCNEFSDLRGTKVEVQHIRDEFSGRA